MPFLVPSSEFSQVPSQATISLLNIPLPPLNPGASTAGSTLPLLLLLVLGVAGTSTMRGDFAPLRGISTTIGDEFRGALVLGARLLLLARDMATDILFLRLRVLCKCDFEKGSCFRGGLDEGLVQGEATMLIWLSLLRPRRDLLTGNAADRGFVWPGVDDRGCCVGFLQDSSSSVVVRIQGPIPVCHVKSL